jgi:uncharacterized RDD family membrane protein YckC
MTQPPDDRVPPPGEPDSEAPTEPVTPENAPTVAWSPPGSGVVPEGGTTPSEPDATQAASETPPPEAPPARPPSPIISADTATPPPQPGWQLPGAPPPLPPALSGGGWEPPPMAAAPMEQQPGYVIAGVGARFVAWLIDGLLSSIVPLALGLVLLDWNALFGPILDQMRLDPTGRAFATGMVTFPVTLNLVLITLIGVGIQFLYFVGFWTSRWQATPGMIGLKMRVVDANTGGELSLMQASKRWVAMGWPLSLMILVPVLQNAAGLAQFALNVILFFSTVTNDRKQGFHDKFAGSLVIRSVTSGDGATFIGCLVYIVIVILLTIVAALAFFVVAGPTFIEFARDYPRYQP